MRRIIGATGSSRPYSNENSRRNVISTAMEGKITRYPSRKMLLCAVSVKIPRRRRSACDETQARHRLHAGRGSRLFGAAGCEASAGGAVAGSRATVAGYAQGDGPGGGAEDLAARDPQ